MSWIAQGVSTSVTASFVLSQQQKQGAALLFSGYLHNTFNSDIKIEHKKPKQ